MNTRAIDGGRSKAQATTFLDKVGDGIRRIFSRNNNRKRGLFETQAQDLGSQPPKNNPEPQMQKPGSAENKRKMDVVEIKEVFDAKAELKKMHEMTHREFENYVSSLEPKRPVDLKNEAAREQYVSKLKEFVKNLRDVAALAEAEKKKIGEEPKRKRGDAPLTPYSHIILYLKSVAFTTERIIPEIENLTEWKPSGGRDVGDIKTEQPQFPIK